MLQTIAFVLAATFVPVTTTDVAVGPTRAMEFIADNRADSHAGKHPPKEEAEIKRTEFGQTGNPRRVTRTIQIDTSDAMRFTPAEITVKRGETVRFVVTNSGKQMHELVLGTMAELKEHAALMKKHPEMEHDDAYMAHVAPGKKAQIVWQFTNAGEFHYGCLIPGHFEAGMIGQVIVRP